MSGNEWMNASRRFLLLLKGDGPIGETLRAPPLGNQSNCIFKNEPHRRSVSLVPLIPFIEQSHFS